MEKELGTLLTEVLTSEIDKSKTFQRVVSAQDVSALLGYERLNQIVGCTDTSCLTEIGGALGVERLLASNIGKVGETYVINLKLINVPESKTEARYYESFKGEAGQLIEAIPNAIHHLLLHYRRGHAGNTAATGPSAGSKSFSTADKDSGLSVSAVVLLGLSVVSGGLGVGFGVKALGHNDRANNTANTDRFHEIEAGQDSQRIANVSYAVAGSAAIAGLLFWILTDSDEAPQATLVPIIDESHVLVGISGSL